MTSSVQAEAGGGGGGAGGIAEAASRYVIRLQERVKQADQAALRGNALMSDGDYEQAMASFRDALALLPDATMTKDRRQAYITQYSAAAVALAKQRAEDGKYADALALLDSVLAADVDPDNAAAKRLRQEIMDPEIYPQAMNEDLRNRIRTVDAALKNAQGAVDLGEYDQAERYYNTALANDPYNEAARRGLEKMERHKLEYAQTARDHTRARFIREIEMGWELPVPRTIDNDLDIKTLTTDGAEGVAAIEEKLKSIILPSVEFVDTPLREALEFLTQKSAELDTQTTDPTKKGINFILSTGASGGGGGGAAPAAGIGGFDAPAGGAAPAGGGGFGGDVGDTAITLKLQNVPLVEAVRYTTSLAQLKYKVEPHAVVVVPLSTPDADLYTNVYQVPPTFLNSGGGGDGGAGAGPVDPFAAPAGGGGGTTLEKRPDARQILERAGVTFGEGSSAIYQAAGSQLIVRNTQDQMELVEAYIESLKGNAEKQIYITTKFIEIGQEVNDELGFDWLLGPFNINSSATSFASGGTPGSQGGTVASDYPFVNPGGTSPVGGNPVTAGNRSGGFAVSDDSIDGLIASASGTGAGAPTKAPGIFGVAGVFTDVQYQVVIRALNQQKGVDLLSAPSVMARSGQRAKVEVIREFIYPTEYDPPEIPNQIGATAGIGAGGGIGGGFPVTPANPTAFETRNTGVTLEVDPVIGADNFTIDLNLAPEVVEFEGFINYGSPIQTTSQNPITGVSSPVVLTENRILQPVFNTRRVTTQITIWDGQTVAIGGLIREDIQDVEDKVMLLGDLPIIGRLFRSSVERHLKRNLTVFVTAKIKDPSGQDFHGNKATEAPDAMVVPPVPGPRPLSGPTVFAPMPGPAK
jgi:general secretion pathway protein D